MKQEQSRLDGARQIRQGDVLADLFHDLLQSDTGLGIDHQRCAQARENVGLATFFLLEQHLHHGHILGSRRLQDGCFGIREGQLVVEAERHRIDDLQGQRRIVQGLQRIAARLASALLMNQHEALALLEANQAVRECNDLFRIYINRTEQIGFYFHTLPPQFNWNNQHIHPTPTAHGCIFQPDCA